MTVLLQHYMATVLCHLLHRFSVLVSYDVACHSPGGLCTLFLFSSPLFHFLLSLPSPTFSDPQAPFLPIVLASFKGLAAEIDKYAWAGGVLWWQGVSCQSSEETYQMGALSWQWCAVAAECVVSKQWGNTSCWKGNGVREKIWYGKLEPVEACCGSGIYSGVARV